MLHHTLRYAVNQPSQFTQATLREFVHTTSLVSHCQPTRLTANMLFHIGVIPRCIAHIQIYLHINIFQFIRLRRSFIWPFSHRIEENTSIHLFFQPTQLMSPEKTFLESVHYYYLEGKLLQAFVSVTTENNVVEGNDKLLITLCAHLNSSTEPL